MGVPGIEQHDAAGHPEPPTAGAATSPGPATVELDGEQGEYNLCLHVGTGLPVLEAVSVSHPLTDLTLGAAEVVHDHLDRS
ncbi:hypothetical protein [Streptomyces sp. BK022]|uniref:hypothetical protein n=1 Tax=Streptomyces sp. BK022 TaxID=2512123 RepID=UPI001F5EF472|nr:hypothetical protein [Streptomyces sp. BK022]